MYRALQTRSKVDDFIGLGAGFVLLGLAVYTELGTFLGEIFSSVSDFLARSTAYIIAASFALTAVMIASKTRSKIISILLIICSMAILGVSIFGVFR